MFVISKSCLTQADIEAEAEVVAVHSPRRRLLGKKSLDGYLKAKQSRMDHCAARTPVPLHCSDGNEIRPCCERKLFHVTSQKTLPPISLRNVGI